jgi:hypothetical protein
MQNVECGTVRVHKQNSMLRGKAQKTSLPTNLYEALRNTSKRNIVTLKIDERQERKILAGHRFLGMERNGKVSGTME